MGKTTRTVGEQLAFYTTRRRKSDYAVIAEATGYSDSHVSNVLAGRRNNDTIVKNAYRMVKSRKTK